MSPVQSTEIRMSAVESIDDLLVRVLVLHGEERRLRIQQLEEAGRSEDLNS